MTLYKCARIFTYSLAIGIRYAQPAATELRHRLPRT